LKNMGNLHGIVEANQERLNELTSQYDVEGFLTVEDAMAKGFDGYTIATPAPTHYEIGKKLLENGNHLLIEKPMTLSSKESEELVAIAEKNGVNLMVGHVLLFHPAIIKIKELIDAGKIGQLYYLYSTRLNLGTVRTEENVFWSFAPHDISILDYLVGKPSISIETKGTKFLQKNVYDNTMTQLTYLDNIHAHIFVSWLHPFKEQRLVVVGSEGMLSFEDSSKDKNIIFHNKYIDFENGIPLKYEVPDEIIPYEKGMPLTEELTYFVENLDKGFTVSDGKSGLEVVKVLEKAQELIDKQE
ncbi:MAG: oxidoreductase, partial [Clostridiales bacterium]